MPPKKKEDYHRVPPAQSESDKMLEDMELLTVEAESNLNKCKNWMQLEEPNSLQSHESNGSKCFF
jgi:hypothetical protein